MSQAFHDITRFERFTDLNLFKYAFSVIQNWEADAKDGWLAIGFGWLLALIDSPAQHPLPSQPVKKQKGWSLKTP